MTEQQLTLETIAKRAGFPNVTRYDAWLSWQHATGTVDRDRFERSYIGHYATRAAIGEHLLRNEYGAEERLVKLPRWLREYVRLDGEAFVSDFESDGLLLVLQRSTDDGGFFAYQPGVYPTDSAEGVAIEQQLGA